MLTALITGAGGFCAAHLARRVRGEGGVRICGADRSRPRNVAIFDEFTMIDVADPEQLAGTIRRLRPDWVFHLAAIVGGTAEQIYHSNLMGTFYLLESLRLHAGEARVLLVGSAAEYGHVPTVDLPVTEDYACNPSGAYGGSKYATTLVGLNYARHFGMKVVVARPFNIVGAGMSPMLVGGAILRRIRDASSSNNPVVKVGNLDSVRDFVAVEDIVDAYVRMIQGNHWGEVFNLCSGRPCSIRDLVGLIALHASRPIEIQVDPELIRSKEPEISYGSWQKAHRAFGFEPTISLADAISEAWEYEAGAVC